MNNIKFPYYPSNVKITKPLGLVSLEHFIRGNKDPNPKMKETFRQIQKASEEGNESLKGLLKQSLYYFNPCVNTDGLGRSYSNITSFTGLCVMEFDKISFARELKYEVFNKLKSCVCAYMSPSGYGVKFIIRIPVVTNIEDFKSYFYGLGFYFEHIAGFDPSAQNCILPLYLSWDEDLLYREDAEIWTQRGEKINDWSRSKPDIDIESLDPTKADKLFVINIISKRIREIEDNGHPQVVKTSLILGGFIASGYIEYDEGVDLIEDLIENNEYLTKDIPGYKRTAKQMINKGTEKALPLEKK